jgi:hypothetical protein
MKNNLESFVELEVDALGYDIVLLRQTGTRTRPVLEIRIDRRDGERVSIADCVRVSRGLEASLDARSGDDAIFGGRRYELQVSSPGDAPRRSRPTQPTDVTGTPGNNNDADRTPDPLSPQQSSPTRTHTDDGSRDGRFD